MLYLVAQSCPTLYDPMDCSPLGSSAHGDSPGKNTGVGCHALLQRIFQRRDRTQVSRTACRFFTVWATRKAYIYILGGRHGNSLQYSCLEKPMDRGPWWATVHGVARSLTWLKWLITHTYTHTHTHIYLNHFVVQQKLTQHCKSTILQ